MQKKIFNQLTSNRRNNMKPISKKYILITWCDYTKDKTLIMNNSQAMDYIIENSDTIEFMEYVDILLPEK